MERWRNDRDLAENRRNNVAVSSHFLLHSIKATTMQNYSAKKLLVPFCLYHRVRLLFSFLLLLRVAATRC